MLFKSGATIVAVGWVLLGVFACVGFATDQPDLVFYPVPVLFAGISMMLASVIAGLWER